MLNYDNLRKFIKAYGSDAELAKAVGVCRQHVWHIRNGHYRPGRKFIEGVLLAGMRKEDLFDAQTDT